MTQAEDKLILNSSYSYYFRKFDSLSSTPTKVMLDSFSVSSSRLFAGESNSPITFLNLSVSEDKKNSSEQKYFHCT